MAMSHAVKETKRKIMLHTIARVSCVTYYGMELHEYNDIPNSRMDMGFPSS